jgi:hypothetical protein
MCMITEQKKMKKVKKQEICYQIKRKKPNGDIHGVFRHSRGVVVALGSKYFACRSMADIIRYGKVESGVFHCFGNIDDVKEIVNRMVNDKDLNDFSVFDQKFLGGDSVIIVECLGSGEKVSGVLDGFGIDFDRKPCVGYTEITYIKEIEV